MTSKEIIQWLYKHPERIGPHVGFNDLTPLHGEWIRNIVFGDDDYTLMAHRAAFKSSIMAIAIALLMVLFPTLNIIFIRKADSDVSEMMRMVLKILDSQLFKDIVRILYQTELQIVESSSDKISTNLWTSPMGSPQLLGLGIGSSITGKHCEVLITDDICNVKDRISQAERERTKLAFMEMQNICNRGGRIISLGTKWHKEDVFTLMRNIHTYDCYSTGLMTPEQIQQKREQMSPSLFACNYELKIIADENALFGSANWLPPSESNAIHGGKAHIDAAYDGEDYTAYTILKKDGDRFIGYGKIWRKHVDLCLNEIDALHAMYEAGSIATETNADKGYLAKELKARGHQVNTYQEHQNKYLKIATILRKYWKQIYWIDETDPEYISQILDYTEDAAHDDAPDSCASLLRAMSGEVKVNTSSYLIGGVL